MPADRPENQMPRIGLAKGLVLLFGIRRGISQMRKQGPPMGIGMILGERAKAVVGKAEQLAREEREDPAAVSELQKIAGRSRHALSDAALSLHFLSRYLEVRSANRAFRLLEAAQAGTPVVPEDPSLTARLDAVASLQALSHEAAFDKLSTMEPRLLTIRPMETPEPGEIRTMNREQLKDLGRDQLRLHAELAPIVGPKRTEYDLLLSTSAAQALAAYGLTRRPSSPG